MSVASDLSIQELKKLFGSHLQDASRLKKPEGIPTGFEALDSFLFWGGFPKGSLSLMSGALGTGGTSLWIEAAAHSIQKKKWVAWVSFDAPLMPLPLQQKGVNLGHFVSIEAPENEEKLLWLLQELMSSGLFDLIGCDLGERRLRDHQLRKLQTQARDTNLSLVFLTRKAPPRGVAASLFSLILRLEKRRILIERALHRPTPHSFPRSVSYARFTVHTADRIIAGPIVSGPSECVLDSDHARSEPRALPEAPGTGTRTEPNEDGASSLDESGD